MQFDEQNVIEFPHYQNSFIYFLVKQKEVVYVGQTRKGITRPLSHKDKEYDTIYIKYCDVAELDKLEDKYILKYRPILNKECNSVMRYGLQKVKRKIRKEFNAPKFNIWKLKEILNELNIKTNIMYGVEVISIFEYYDVINFIKKEAENGHIRFISE